MKRQPYVFVANHRSYFDVPALGAALKQLEVRWAAKKEMLSVPFLGRALQASKNVIIDRGSPNRAIQSFKAARDKIEAGISVIFFPEGTRSRNGRVLPFKKGGFLVAVETGTPVVPVTINGSDRVFGKKQWQIKGGEIEIVISPPIPVNGYTRDDLEILCQQARNSVVEHHHR